MLVEHIPLMVDAGSSDGAGRVVGTADPWGHRRRPRGSRTSPVVNLGAAPPVGDRSLQRTDRL